MMQAGNVLVGVDKGDLGYLGIKALGHRKMLLAGIAEIKMDQSSTVSASTETVCTRAPVVLCFTQFNHVRAYVVALERQQVFQALFQKG